MPVRGRVYDTRRRSGGRRGHESREKETSEVKMTYNSILQLVWVGTTGRRRRTSEGAQTTKGENGLTENIGSKLKVVAV